MRISILVFGLFLLFSCERKQKAIATDLSKNQKEIVHFYNLAIQKNGIVSDSFNHFQNRLETISQNEPPEYKAMAAIAIGSENSRRELFQLGIKNYEKGLTLLDSSTVDSLKAYALSGIGSNGLRTGDYPKATKNLFEALTLYEKIKDTLGIGRVNNLLGNVYLQMDQMDKAKSFILKSMQVLDNRKSSLVYLSAAHSLANIYGASGDYEKALKIDDMGIRVSDSIGALEKKVSFLDNKANCYFFQIGWIVHIFIIKSV